MLICTINVLCILYEINSAIFQTFQQFFWWFWQICTLCCMHTYVSKLCIKLHRDLCIMHKIRHKKFNNVFSSPCCTPGIGDSFFLILIDNSTFPRFQASPVVFNSIFCLIVLLNQLLFFEWHSPLSWCPVGSSSLLPFDALQTPFASTCAPLPLSFGQLQFPSASSVKFQFYHGSIMVITKSILCVSECNAFGIKKQFMSD